MRLRLAQATQQNLVLKSVTKTKSLVLTLLSVTPARKLWRNGSNTWLPDTKVPFTRIHTHGAFNNVTPFFGLCSIVARLFSGINTYLCSVHLYALSLGSALSHILVYHSHRKPVRLD